MHIPNWSAEPWITAAWIAVVFAVGYALYRLLARYLVKRGRKPVWGGIALLFVYAFGVSAAVFIYQRQAEKVQLQQWAKRMAHPRDLDSEALFTQRMATLSCDTIWPALLNASDSLSAYLKHRYFSEHWRGYHFFMTLCKSEEILQIDSAVQAPCLDFFSEKINRIGAQTNHAGLYVMDYGIEYYSYLYRLNLTDLLLQQAREQDTTSTAATAATAAQTTTPAPTYLFVEWGRPKFNRQRSEIPRTYSYAYYVNGALWSRRGDYLYDFDISEKTIPEAKNDTAAASFFVQETGFLHCIFRISPAQLLVLTTPALKLSSWLYYFSFFLCVFFMGGLLVEGLRHRTLFRTKTYTQRLQYTIFGLVSCAFAILGVVSFFFIRDIDRDEQTDRLKEKSLSALTALESRFMELSPNEFPTADLVHPLAPSPGNETFVLQTTQFLSELARVLSTEIYLFDRNGHFLLGDHDLSQTGSEAPTPLCRQPFFAELQAKNSHLLIRQAPSFLTTATPTIPTAYTPFRNADNEILGYIVMPYLDKGHSLSTVMHRYWGVFLNLFVWIGLLTLLAAYLLSRYVTRPLKLLGKQMSKLQLTDNRLSAPEPLVWHSQDEIGTLVAQYNHTTAQLAESVKQLAEAERQSAWQQMARQVAHEIKNPLTPLQLQIQQLERAYHDGKPDFDQRLARFADLLRTQIASLSHIADTFSQLAQWQQPQWQTMALRQSVERAAALFAASAEFSFEIDDNTMVRVDAQWLHQILTNLFRNAVQAMEEAQTPKPHIAVSAQAATAEAASRTAAQTANRIILHICDNGPGIASEKQERIFEPHFTTRSSGSGLGLAISRRLAEGMQGTLTYAPAAASTDTLTGAHFILQLSAPQQP